MSVQLGINPLTWTNDDLPSLGAETPLETCLSEGKEAGFAGFELGSGHGTWIGRHHHHHRQGVRGTP